MPRGHAKILPEKHAEFTRLYQNPAVRVPQIASHYGVTPAAVSQLARRLALPYKTSKNVPIPPELLDPEPAREIEIA